MTGLVRTEVRYPFELRPRGEPVAGLLDPNGFLFCLLSHRKTLIKPS